MSESERLPDPTLLTWAAQYTRYKFNYVTDATYLTPLLIPAPTAIIERAVVSRWITWVGLLTDFVINDLTLPPEQATSMWRGLRAVAEQRAAPTSPLGMALNDIVANLMRLPNVTPADRTLVGVATGRLLDGLARRYEWQQRSEQPRPEYVHKALVNSSGVWGVIALLGAVRDWRLSEVLNTHPARKAVDLVEAAAWAAQQPTGLPPQQLADLQTHLASLPKEWRDFARWSLVLVEGYQTWATVK